MFAYIALLHGIKHQDTCHVVYVKVCEPIVYISNQHDQHGLRRY